jgi:hypothetical protein
MQTVSHPASPPAANDPLHEAGVFLEAMICMAVYGLVGRLTQTEALEQCVILGGRVERFLEIAAWAA